MQAQPYHPFHPDSPLYIYYIQGRIPGHYRFSSPDFLGNWEEDGFSFVFFRKPASRLIDGLLSTHSQLQLLDTYEMTYEQWQGGKIEPMAIGPFLFTPPWLRGPATDPPAITLDPGVVFGNGIHPTTRDCLEAIGLVCSGKKVQTMLDLGCGSGILALAAISLGCRRALAVDFNFLAATTTRRNAELNRMDDRLHVVQGRAEDYVSVVSDLLVANIHFSVMNRLVRTPDFLRQKWFLLSGLLASEAQVILDFLAALPVIIIKKWQNNGVWTTILGITRED